MSVDLSKARKGDRVKFRCGGEAVVHAIEGERGFYFIERTEQGRPFSISYEQDGKYSGSWTTQGLLDIVELIPAPFDWKDVRPGMAFKCEDDQEFWIFVSREFVGQPPQLGRIGYFQDAYCLGRKQSKVMDSALTRAPEHDIEVPQ